MGRSVSVERVKVSALDISVRASMNRAVGRAKSPEVGDVSDLRGTRREVIGVRCNEDVDLERLRQRPERRQR